MPESPVRQSQITRALKAVQAAGVAVAHVEVSPDGTVRIFAAAGDIGHEADDLETRIQRMASNGAE